MKLKITLKGFKKWLSGYADDDRVGFAGYSRECPLSAYLGSQVDLEQPGPLCPIYVDQAVYISGERNYPLPAWARRFVRHIDALKAHMPHEDCAVTAREAREILEYETKKGN
jgi:hypothetical protein